MVISPPPRYRTGYYVNIPALLLQVSQEELLAHMEPYLPEETRIRLERARSREAPVGRTEAADGARARARPSVRDLLHVCGRALQWLWALALTSLCMITGSMFGLFGGIVGWSGLRALFGLGSGQGEWWHAPVGLVMMIVGAVLVFRWMDPVLRTLSGRKPVEPGV